MNKESSEKKGQAGKLRGRPPFTRDWGLLVTDQDILNFVGHLNGGQLREVAGRFDEIACIILEARAGELRSGVGGGQESGERTLTLSPILSKIRKIGRESRAREYRKIVTEIEEGVRSGDGFSAQVTAEAVVAEVFQYTSWYYRAMEEFCLSLRAMRKKP
ncbi:MAG TPA: hypothetical protein VI756_01365 [Blastocatellia bacterium]